MTTVESIELTRDRVPDQTRWPNEMVVGPAAHGVVGRTQGLSYESQQRILDETSEILKKCLPPGCEEGRRTGLVIGYVQSGKTLSFTTLAAMARDNGYQLVIVLAGTTTNLVDQCADRLRRDLDIGRTRDWRLLRQPREGVDADYQRLDIVLRQWRRRPGQITRNATALIVTMKQHDNLRHLRGLLSRCDVNGITTLVVDDEGDQVGLNTRVRRRDESPTYRELRLLREALPRHSYILYTATPQAPLLISRIDMLSPDFAGLLTPGEGYVGGRDYFFEGSAYVETIPSSEVPEADAPEQPPPSLIRAMRLFILGVAAGLLQGGPNNRSMMVHPSRLQEFHATYLYWTQRILADWAQVLEEPPGSPDRDDLWEEFREAYLDLARTIELPSFEQLAEELKDAIGDTLVSEMNTRDGNPIAAPDWTEQYGNILVGGIALDRGFTVEGLTVTYMPRSTGTGNADTIQQRGRFFGYKRSYLGYCRLYLEADTEAAFRAYIDHEEQMRASLRRFIEAGLPLQDWRRAFFLDSTLRPTRNSVLSTDYVRPLLFRNWSYPRSPQLTLELVAKNRAPVDSFLEGIPHSPYRGNPNWTNEQTPPRHVQEMPLAAVYEGLLAQMIYPEEGDSLNLTLLLLQLERLLESDPAQTCDLYLMSEAGDHRYRKLHRERNDRIRLEGFFQGRNEPTGYPGAAEIRSAVRPTIQIHRYDLTLDGEPVAQDVPIVAVHLPRRLQAPMIFQPHN